MTTIKITQLTDIGANLATSTVLPVVNMAGTPTTQKTTVGNIANLALSQAGNSYPAAAQAVLAQTVTNTAQPNITSVGTLTGLTVSGNASINGNITSNGTAYLGNISTTGSASITTLSVGATANLGAVGNITITGGSNGQVLTTAGNGSLSWTTGTLTGDGGNISNIAGANVTGTVANANLSQYLDISDVNNNFSYHVVLSAGSGDKSLHIDADDNLQYNPADGTLTATRVDATYVLADLQFSNGYPAANVTGLGNIATINLTGSNSNVLYGNGVFAPASGANTGNVTFDDVTVQGVNELNLSAGPDYTANLAYLQVRAGDVASHIHFDTGNSEAYDLIVGNDAKFVQVSSTGNIIMSSYDGNTSHIMTLDTTGNLILAGGNSIVRSVANSSLDPLNPNVSTMIFTPESGYSSQSLVLDPTAPGHIHLRAPGANIDEPYANIFLGGEESSFEVGYYNGSAPNVFIHSGGNTWTFGTDSNLTTSSNLVIGPGPGSGSSILQYDDVLQIVGEGANSAVIMGWAANQSTPDSVATIAMNFPSLGEGNVLIAVGNNATTVNYWNFDNTGNVTLPGNTVAINFANGSAAFGNIVATNLDGNVSNVLTGNGTFVALPVINANTVVWSTAPVANNSAGTAGQAAYDSGGNLYVCVATDTWAKFAGTTSW